MSGFDWSAATAASVRRATDEALAAADAELALAIAAPTIEALLAHYDASSVAALAAGPAGFMGHVHDDPEVRAAGHEAEQRLSGWFVDRPFRDDLASAVTALTANGESGRLDGEPARLLAFLERALRRAGHGLAPSVRAEVQTAQNRLVELGVEFAKNLAEDDTALLFSRDDLDGLPESFLAGLQPGPEPGTYRVTMSYPDVQPVLENARRRDVRQRLHAAFNGRVVEANRPLLEDAVGLRQHIADQFGEPSWADHRMDHRMAASPRAVEAFYDDLVGPLTVKADAELAVIAARLRADTGDGVVQPWDLRYYDNQLRKSDFGVDQFEVAAYFPLEQVLDGLLSITAEVFGLRYEPDDAPAWHPDVRSLAIFDADTGRRIATVHMDLHPRDGKFGHAAAWDAVPGHRGRDGYVTPVSAIVANFTKPTPDTPSLLVHDEVVTLFHEFGHVLHQTLTRAELVEFAGTNVELDFVEAPSQIMEHWCWRADVLGRFARHHETGEPIPAALVDRLVAARDLNSALFQLRQMQFGVLDLGLHGPARADEVRADGSRDLDAVLARATAVSRLPMHEGTFMPASFGHLFGYDAGYYGYMWSEVYGDDMFSRFAREGVLDPAVGRAYRRSILERGGTRDAMEMIAEFLGRAPNQDAFLAKLGIGHAA